MLSVLVVDADDDALKAIGEILHGAGIGASLASTGLHALTLFRRVLVDVVVVDLRLPDFGGIELLRGFRDERSGVPVIVTGVASPAAAIEAGRLGAADYLEKPVRAEQLIDAVLSHVPTVHHLSSAEAQPPTWTNPQVLQAVRAIDDRYWDSELTLRSLAREVGVSSEHLCRVLRRQTGGTFVALLRRARVGAACRLLTATSLCMKEIAAHVGFSSPNRFARDFKKVCGVTPSEYRVGALRGDAPQEIEVPVPVAKS